VAPALTTVDHLKLADQVQPDLAEIVLEQLQEQRQQVLDRRVLAEKRGEARDLGGEGGADVLARVAGAVAHAREDTGEDDFAVEKLCETWNGGSAT
jgi:broad specificity phosphatase PhoE